MQEIIVRSGESDGKVTQSIGTGLFPRIDELFVWMDVSGVRWVSEL